MGNLCLRASGIFPASPTSLRWLGAEAGVFQNGVRECIHCSRVQGQTVLTYSGEVPVVWNEVAPNVTFVIVV